MTREEMQFLLTKLESIRDYLLGPKFAIRGLEVGPISELHSFTTWFEYDDEDSQVVRFKVRGKRILMKCVATANFVDESKSRDIPWTGSLNDLDVIVMAELALVKKFHRVGYTA